MSSETMSFVASEIMEGLNEALQDAKGVPVKGVKKTVVYRVEPKEIMLAQSMSSSCKNIYFDIYYK